MKATERNAFVMTASSKVSGSYVTMRVPGSPNKLAMFEYNSFATNSMKDLEDDGGTAWGSLVKPLFMIALLGGTCWISYSSVKKRGTSRGSGGSTGAFGSSKKS